MDEDLRGAEDEVAGLGTASMATGSGTGAIQMAMASNPFQTLAFRFRVFPPTGPPKASLNLLFYRKKQAIAL